jgi:hypothetical protein
MKYFELVDSMVNNPDYGFKNIACINQEFKDKIIEESETTTTLRSGGFSL